MLKRPLEKLTIEEMRKLAAARNGKCISTEYINAHTKLEWMCSKGHVWFATPDNIKRGKWCSDCSVTKKLTIEEMHELAENRNGKCLSTEYINARTKLEWMCSEGHVWMSTPSDIKTGSWCTECAESNRFSEAICKTTFEQLFNEKFVKCKPSWLRNSRGNLMELDGYCERLKIAFEYQGVQHYRISHFSPNKQILKQRIFDDELKSDLCEKRGITLIVVDYSQDLTKLPEYIETQLILNAIKTKEINFKKEIDFNKIYFHKTKIEEMNELAAVRGGKCLSTKYLGMGRKLEWMCAEGHVWKSAPGRIKKGYWCSGCAGNKRLTIEDMHKLAAARNGKCLSIEYINARTKLEWMCSKGHVWFATPDSIKQGSWCNDCGGSKRLTIEDMHKLAESRNGKCLSREYINAHTKLEWICADGHVWKAIPANIKKGKWCLRCYRLKRSRG